MGRPSVNYDVPTTTEILNGIKERFPNLVCGQMKLYNINVEDTAHFRRQKPSDIKWFSDISVLENLHSVLWDDDCESLQFKKEPSDMYRLNAEQSVLESLYSRTPHLLRDIYELSPLENNPPSAMAQEEKLRNGNDESLPKLVNSTHEDPSDKAWLLSTILLNANVINKKSYLEKLYSCNAHLWRNNCESSPVENNPSSAMAREEKLPTDNNESLLKLESSDMAWLLSTTLLNVEDSFLKILYSYNLHLWRDIYELSPFENNPSSAMAQEEKLPIDNDESLPKLETGKIMETHNDMKSFPLKVSRKIKSAMSNYVHSSFKALYCNFIKVRRELYDIIEELRREKIRIHVLECEDPKSCCQCTRAEPYGLNSYFNEIDFFNATLIFAAEFNKLVEHIPGRIEITPKEFKFYFYEGMISWSRDNIIRWGTDEKVLSFETKTYASEPDNVTGPYVVFKCDRSLEIFHLLTNGKDPHYKSSNTPLLSIKAHSK